MRNNALKSVLSANFMECVLKLPWRDEKHAPVRLQILIVILLSLTYCATVQTIVPF